jgi:hypothetical protein
MFSRGLFRRTLPIGTAATAAFLFAAPGRAAPTEASSPEACASMYARAQEQEKAGHLRDARESLVACARAACGPGLLQQCSSRFAHLESTEIPSILPRVTDDTGSPRVDVQVRMDGEVLTRHLGGQALAVDPGPHAFSFTTADGLSATERVTIVRGHRNRPLEISLHAGEKGASAASGGPLQNSETSANDSETNEANARSAAPLPSNPRACKAVYKNAQELERAGHLRDARELLMTCARQVCGAALHQQCSAMFSQLDSTEIPSVLPIVTDESGQPRVDVQVRVDGQLLASHLSGQALPVDPGLHEFSFAAGGGLSATQKVLVVEGQLNRSISVSLHGSDKPPAEATASTDIASDKTSVETGAAATPPPAPSAPPDDSPHESARSALPYLIGGGALAVVEAGALGVYLTKSDKTHLATDVAVGASLGIGAAAVGVAVWLFARSHADAAADSAHKSAYVFDVAPSPSGAVGSVSGSF